MLFVLSEWWYSDHGYDDILVATDNPARLISIISHRGGVETRIHWPQTKHPYRWITPGFGRVVAAPRSEQDSRLEPPYYETEQKDMPAVNVSPAMRFKVILIGIPYRLVLAAYLALWALVMFLLRARWRRKVAALAAEVKEPETAEG